MENIVVRSVNLGQDLLLMTYPTDSLDQTGSIKEEVLTIYPLWSNPFLLSEREQGLNYSLSREECYKQILDDKASIVIEPKFPLEMLPFSIWTSYVPGCDEIRLMLRWEVSRWTFMKV